MSAYILKRLLIFVPTFLVVTLISFLIMQSAPGDPVELLLRGESPGDASFRGTGVSTATYLAKRRELGLDKPLFYAALSTLATPDTLYRVPIKAERDALKALLNKSGNWPRVQTLHRRLLSFNQALFALDPPAGRAGKALVKAKSMATSLTTTDNPVDFADILKAISEQLRTVEPPPSVRSAFRALEDAFERYQTDTALWKTYVPALSLYGIDNQYHHWLMGLFTLDFGVSYFDKEPVEDKLFNAIQWSLVLNLSAILLTYLIAIPIGVYAAQRRNSPAERATTTGLFILYSLPSFWVATLLITFLSSGDFIEIFPASGVHSNEYRPDWPWFRRMADLAFHLILPVFSLSYASFAFLSRQMRVGMLDTLGQDFIRTARAKGLREKIVQWKHAFRNSLIPMITIFASIFPLMVGGSVVIEYIFSIPGMGLVGYKSILARDYPVIVGVFTLAALMTLVGILVADILYARADPRISFGRRS